MRVQKLSDLPRRPDLVPVALPDEYFNSTSEISQGSTVAERTYVFMNNVLRIRQTGRIAGLEIKTGSDFLSNNGDITTLELVVFRRDGGDGFFDLVDSYDFTTQFQALTADDTVFTITFPDGSGPFANKDDYYGIRIISGGASSGIFKSAASASYVNNSMNLFDGVMPTTNADIDGTWSDIDDIPKIRALMKSPWAVCLGDSLTQGEQNISQDNGPWEQERSVVDSLVTYPDKLEKKIGQPIQNSGLGSVSTVRNVLNAVEDRVLNMKPRVCFILVGSNDVAQGTDPEKYKFDYKQLLDTIIKDEIVPVVCKIVPRDDLTDAENVIREDLNNFIQTEGDRRGLLVIDAESEIGSIQEDKTQAFNYWNIKSSFNSGDNIHLSEAGYEALADFIFDELKYGKYPAPVLNFS